VCMGLLHAVTFVCHIALAAEGVAAVTCVDFDSLDPVIVML